MAFERCPKANTDCKYYDKPPVVEGESSGCYSDRDHIYPKRIGKTAIEKAFSNLTENVEQRCRREHEERNARHDQGDTSDIPEFPSPEIMREAIALSKRLQYEGDIEVPRRFL